jgi:hypothetical protein
MPRKFARTSAEIIHDPQCLPRTFQPDRQFCISRPINDVSMPPRQLRCLRTTKTARSTEGTATLPVIAIELEAHAAGLPVVFGRALYSAVQAAGIYQNANLDLQALILPVAFGYAFPQLACWPGSLNYTGMNAKFKESLQSADVRPSHLSRYLPHLMCLLTGLHHGWRSTRSGLALWGD